MIPTETFTIAKACKRFQLLIKLENVLSELSKRWNHSKKLSNGLSRNFYGNKSLQTSSNSGKRGDSSLRVVETLEPSES